MNNNQSGNVVIIVLVTVALFAALIFTFTRSSEQGVSDVSAQQARLAAQEIITYGTSLQAAYDRLRQKGCSENDISFYTTAWQTGNGTPIDIENPNAPLDETCHIFSLSGAKMTAVPFGEGGFYSSPALTQGKAGHPFIRSVSIEGVGTDKPEVILAVNFVTEPLCEALNFLTRQNAVLPTIGDNKDGWNGSYWLQTATGVLGDEDNSLTGHRAFCWKNSSDSSYTYAHVILER